MGIRILVVDDHPVVREGIITMLRRQPDMEVVGEAGDGQSAIDLAEQLQPDVALLDLRLPEVDGVAATAAIPRVAPDCQVVILTTYDDDELIMSALAAGARGYLLKDAPRAEIYRAIRAAARGESVLHPAVAARVLGQMRREEQDPLTEREKKVLQLLAAGASNKQIAAQLFISESTVKTHVAHIYEKLGVKTRAEAAVRALQLRLL